MERVCLMDRISRCIRMKVFSLPTTVDLKNRTTRKPRVSGLDTCGSSRCGPNSQTTTVVTPDVAIELFLERLIRVLDEQLSRERVGSLDRKHVAWPGEYVLARVAAWNDRLPYDGRSAQIINNVTSHQTHTTHVTRALSHVWHGDLSCPRGSFLPSSN